MNRSDYPLANYSDRDPTGRPKFVVKGPRHDQLWIVQATGELRYGESRTRTYTAPSEAARAAKRLLMRGQLGGIAYREMGPLIQGGLVRLLKECGLERLEDAK